MESKLNLWKKVYKFFDKLEDRVRGFLSKYPILYAIIGGAAIVLFWRGVWHTADLIPFLNGPVSVVVSIVVLLATGLMVSVFIGDSILMSGLRREKKIAEKTEEEVKSEVSVVKEIDSHLEKIERDIQSLKERIK